MLKARKKEKHIPNLSEYFVAALKGDWGSKTVIGDEKSAKTNSQVDTAAVFRHWYDKSARVKCKGTQPMLILTIIF